MDNLRLFLAIDLDSNCIDKISHFQSLLKANTNYVKWTDKSTWHLTLKFLGHQKKDLLNDIITLCKNVAQNTGAFTLELKDVGSFPNSVLPRILFINVLPSFPLSNLFERLEEVLTKIGIKREERSFNPHITLGRIKDARLFLKNSKDFMGFFLEKGKGFSHTLAVDHFTLYQSILKKEGPQYIVLQRFDLQGGV